jgi:hypothetical protein
MDRIYLPGLSADDLGRRRATPALRAVVAQQVARARALFERGVAARKEVEDANRAAADADAALAVAHRAGDPQVLIPVLGNAALVYLEIGDRDTAASLLNETLDELRNLPDLGFPVVELPSVAWVAHAFGRGAEVAEIADGEVLKSPWLLAGQSIAAGDLHAAADVFSEIGAPVDEAFFRLRAAQQLAGEGRRAEADTQLQPALAFFRAANAKRYVREGEALLAASA